MLNNKSPRIFNHGAVVLLAAEPNKATAAAVLTAADRVLRGFLNDGDFVDLLRVIQVALHVGAIPPGEVPAPLRKQLSQEYPALTSGNADGARHINRELVRLLVYLQDETVASRFVEQLRSNEPMEEKLHLACTARFLARGWTTEQRLEVLDFYEKARAIEGGHSLSRYVDNIARDFVATFTAEEQDAVLAKATRWPGAALGALVTLPTDPARTRSSVSRTWMASSTRCQASRRGGCKPASWRCWPAAAMRMACATCASCSSATRRGGLP